MKLKILFLFLLMNIISLAQILNENFDYGTNNDTSLITLTSNWVRHSGTMGPRYEATGLSYTGYASSGIGGCVNFRNGASAVNDGDIHRRFDSVTTTSDIYVSFLLRVDTARSTADYFFHLGPRTIGTIFRGRVFAKSNGSGWSLGLSKFTETPANSNTVLTYATTYLVVLKYSFNTATTSDDQVTLYLYDSDVPATEPGSPLVTIGPTGSGTGSDPANIGSVAIRQGANTPYAFVDGIRVSTNWEQAPLPVELVSFTAQKISDKVKLFWSTATEISNSGFEVHRSNDQQNWTSLGFVAGNGNSNSPKDYAFVDNSIKQSGKYFYRLKQIDNDGSFEYSNVIEVDFSLSDQFSLDQNYPNPFNPTTKISWQAPFSGWQTLKVFDVLGREVATLVDEFREAGRHEINFSIESLGSANNLSSGVYYYQLRIGDFIESRKMLVTK